MDFTKMIEATLRLAALLGLWHSIEELIITGQAIEYPLRSVTGSLNQAHWFMLWVWAALYSMAKGLAKALVAGLAMPEAPVATDPGPLDAMRIGTSILGMGLLLAGASNLGRILVESSADFGKADVLPQGLRSIAALSLLQLGAGLGLFFGVRGLGGLWRMAMAHRPRR